MLNHISTMVISLIQIEYFVCTLNRIRLDIFNDKDITSGTIERLHS